jgi:riboflavin synthase
MFSGIVSHLGKVLKVAKGREYWSVSIEPSRSDFFLDLSLGGSVAVNGVCLTVTTIYATDFTVDLIPETLTSTNLRELHPGSMVNLERSLKLTDENGGHNVSGHVQGVCEVIALQKREKFGMIETLLQLTFNESAFRKENLSKKGYVALNGVSLTVGEIKDSSFEVYLIPETLRRTNLSQLQSGDLVNYEIP